MTRVVATALALALLVASGSTAAQRTQEDGPPPTQLWERFPLGDRPLETAVRPTKRARATPVARPPAPKEVNDGALRSGLEAALAVGAALLVLVGGCYALVAARRRVRRVEPRPAGHYDGGVSALARSGRGRIQLPKEAMAVNVEGSARVDVGVRVNEIIGAAEKAAEQHLGEARDAALAIRRDAQAEADEVRERARQEAGELEQAARGRVQALEERARDLETELGRVLQTLRGAVSEVETALAEPKEASLLEALDVDRRTSRSA